MMSLKDFDLEGKRALVTGGGDGLGRQMTQALVDAGADVYICGRREEVLRRTAGEIKASNNVDIHYLMADVTNPDDIAHLHSVIGDLDILVNNAGVARKAHWKDVTSEDWRYIMTINLESPFWLFQKFVPGMIERGWGRVINIASIYGLIGGDDRRYPGFGLDIASYFASKHGLIGLTKFLAAQVATTGVTVNNVCPGMFYSPGNDSVLTQEVIDALNEGTPMNRMGAEGELRTAILYLASKNSAFTTGQNIVVDGGWTIW
jgi:NAD(P)-dependent dehydrogenase (short-subunit alcohol dehydrogenase family)